MDGGMVAPAAEPTSRSDRLPLLAFVRDAETEATLREGMNEALPGGFEVRRGNVRTALQALGQHGLLCARRDGPDGMRIWSRNGS